MKDLLPIALASILAFTAATVPAALTTTDDSGDSGYPPHTHIVKMETTASVRQAWRDASNAYANAFRKIKITGKPAKDEPAAEDVARAAAAYADAIAGMEYNRLVNGGFDY